MKAILLAGGSGTRFWPLSRELHPKQFLKFKGDRTLIQGTVARLEGVVSSNDIYAVTHRDQALETCRQLEPYGFIPGHLLAEPVGRNTTAAVALACRFLEDDPDEVVGFFPADHLVDNAFALHDGIRNAECLAQKGNLVTLGIPPQRPETGYGYIEAGEAMPQSPGFRVRSFREKPDMETAKDYIACGGFYWNSGMLFGTVRTLLDEIRHWVPEVDSALQSVRGQLETASGYFPFQTLNAEGQSVYEQLPSVSIDYSVLEKTEKACVVPCEMGWCDVGSWEVLHDLFAADDAGNVASRETELIDCHNSLIQADGRLIAALGVDNLIVVDTPDALLVCNRDRAQDIRKLVGKLKVENRKEVKVGTTMVKPWGEYTDLVRQPGYLIKRITVLPGQKLSLQAHRHRAEHWIVAAGTAEVECDGRSQTLNVNESALIPQGSKHRLGNPGDVPLVLIEIQIGEHLSEEDITRFADMYGRDVIDPDEP